MLLLVAVDLFLLGCVFLVILLCVLIAWRHGFWVIGYLTVVGLVIVVSLLIGI